MGSAHTKSHPTRGVPVNPRVEYQDQLSKDSKGARLLDAPVLVRLPFGTIRYRYGEKSNEVLKDRIEKPHEGEDRIGKEGYFYHSRLNDFSQYGNKEKEDAHKFCYVYKGPNSTSDKKVHYVFGKGLQKTKVDEDRKRTVIFDYRKAGHVYYILTFTDQQSEANDSDGEEYDDEIESFYNEKLIQITMNKSQSIDRLKRRLAVRVIKPLGHIHVYLESFGEELQPEMKISDLLPANLRKFNKIQIRLDEK
ncbi:DgyrCDS13457 [Dimorphilus gyrociliatus]|uniref:DgyrCDS13457 n=1 Tax=Dimorphilus gyrociliatus TaxID=2664684 RepID=A0A7I8WAQ9_9ANNE|nr:DgyrCDS13457 [Dimorphilus gyrociliatus]